MSESIAVAESLAELLYRFRSAAKLSQEALAERAGLSSRTISDLETGFSKTPRLVTIMLIAEALSLDDADRARLRDAVRKPQREQAGVTIALPAAQPLIGRDDDAAAVGALLLEANVRLVTLVGTAGVGKTSLAVRVASERREAFPDGVIFVELAPIVDPAHVPGAIAHALGLRDEPSVEVRDAVVARLRNRKMLLVLDNLEHLTPVASWIAALLEGCGAVTILATSREPLRVRAEHVYILKALEAAAAMELFVARARAIQPTFSATESNRTSLATIVARLDGLPLAIELAAPQVRLLPPKALAARLERRLPMLEEGAVDLPTRQQTMRNALAWSYDLLPAAEQRLFRMFSELRGGGTVEAGRAIAATDGESDTDFLLQIATLVEKSLVSLEEDAEAEPRLAMLELLREFAAERLSAQERIEVRRRHAAYFLQFAELAKAQLNGSEQQRWLRRLDRERSNFLAALDSFAHGDDVERGMRLALALSRYWWLRGHLSEGRTWLALFLDACDEGAAIPPQLRARTLRALVVLMSAMGNLEEALPPCEEAVALQRRIGDDEGLAASLNSLGIIMQFRSDLTRSKAAHEESLAIRLRIGDEAGVASSLSNLASIAYTHGELADAARFAQESVAIYRRLNHASGMTHALAKLGLIATGRNEYSDAQAFFEECLALQRSLGHDAFYSLTNLGMVALKLGEVDVALRRHREALELLEIVPNKPALAGTLEGLAAAMNATGESRRAARILGAAGTLREEIGAPLFPRERSDYDEILSATRAALGDADFETQWRIGAYWTLERVLDEALERTH